MSEPICVRCGEPALAGARTCGSILCRDADKPTGTHQIPTRRERDLDDPRFERRSE
jgi:hypothetical protein